MHYLTPILHKKIRIYVQSVTAVLSLVKTNMFLDFNLLSLLNSVKLLVMASFKRCEIVLCLWSELDLIVHWAYLLNELLSWNCVEFYIDFKYFIDWFFCMVMRIWKNGLSINLIHRVMELFQNYPENTT